MHRNAVKTHCPAGHAYDAENTELRSGRRYCRACRRERQRRHVARVKLARAAVRPSVEQRFWAKVRPAGDGSGCLLWTGALRYGYGAFRAEDGRTRVANRWLWEKANGPVPVGLQLDHLCRNRACVNLEHLELVTPGENIRRGLPPLVSGEHFRRLTHCMHGHPFDEANTYRRPSGGRSCRACRRENARRYRRRSI